MLVVRSQEAYSSAEIMFTALLTAVFWVIPPICTSWALNSHIPNKGAGLKYDSSALKSLFHIWKYYFQSSHAVPKNAKWASFKKYVTRNTYFKNIDNPNYIHFSLLPTSISFGISFVFNHRFLLMVRNTISKVILWFTHKQKKKSFFYRNAQFPCPLSAQQLCIY